MGRCVKSCRAATDRNSVFCTDPIGESGFKLSDPWPGRKPLRTKGVNHSSDILVINPLMPVG
jgi:hypothetical protein